MTPQEASKKILEKFKGYETLGCYDYDEKQYLFSITPKGIFTTSDEFYLVDKKSGQIKEYAVLNDIKKFNETIMDKSKILNFR